MQNNGTYRNDRGQASYAPDPNPLSPPPDLSDPARGCGSGWIGPENTAVTELIMFNLSPMVTEDDLIIFFRDNAEVEILNATPKNDKNENKLAHIK
jgi:hypothetical protein